ncbi:MAG TPA: hypothetical protein VFL99_17705 [Segeticoccus sp.]|uniref:hypothetical protein n=1 Tax=Segeticoccus sp. TaxID=2706531 RepID=UPI002D802392|nr:hypothetical protein [Segeticoccus sp.]HET8602163.1 hypothetical protein [Segeticoccus sp.]
MSTQLDTRPETTTGNTGARDRLYSALIGLTALLVLLQGLWAGLFIREGKSFDASAAQARWVEVHDVGARAAIILAAVSFVVALWRLRSRKELLVGTGVLVLLLMLEAYIGGEIGNKPSWPSIHIPLGMALMALSVWLPFRAARRQRTAPAHAETRERG